jgi:ubiquinone/menaquinone biosynthesis C-methylase UbiE
VTGPDRAQALEKYRQRAPTYDRLALLTRGMRRRAVEKLGLEPGQVVLDVGCGTGLTFETIEEGIGTTGWLLGIELSPEMLAVAAERVAAHGWENVRLLKAPAEQADPLTQADAAVLVLVHDITQSPEALRNLMTQMKPGARIAVTGAKRAPAWALPVNGYLRYATRQYITATEGFEQQWRGLAELVPDLQVQKLWLGGAYLAWGTKPKERA